MERLKSANHYDNFSSVFEAVCGENFHVGYYLDDDMGVEAANEALSEQLALSARLKAGEKVLDIGCGIGGPARYIAKHFDVEVVGISNSERGILRAREQPLNGASFHLHDARHLNSLVPRNFDVAWLMESSHLMEDKKSLFQDVSEITNERGRFIICDFFLKTENGTLNKSNVYKMRNIFKAFGKLKLVSAESYIEPATIAGFSGVLIEDISQRVLPTFDHWMNQAGSSNNISADFEDFATAATCLGDLFRDGVLTYNIIKGHK